MSLLRRTWGRIIGRPFTWIQNETEWVPRLDISALLYDQIFSNDKGGWTPWLGPTVEIKQVIFKARTPNNVLDGHTLFRQLHGHIIVLQSTDGDVWEVIWFRLNIENWNPTFRVIEAWKSFLSRYAYDFYMTTIESVPGID